MVIKRSQCNCPCHKHEGIIHAFPCCKSDKKTIELAKKIAEQIENETQEPINKIAWAEKLANDISKFND